MCLNLISTNPKWAILYKFWIWSVRDCQHWTLVPKIYEKNLSLHEMMAIISDKQYIDLLEMFNVIRLADVSASFGGSGGRFKNLYELLTLRALQISMFHKNFIFQCMGKIFCVEFQRYPLKFHTKYLTHTLEDMYFIHRWKFKSSWI